MSSTSRPNVHGPERVFAALSGLAALAVLLQGLWAGIFLEHDGRREEASGWVDTHARGGEVALVLAVLLLAWTVWRLRHRRELVIGAIALVVLLVVESYLGGRIRDDGQDSLTAVHVPLGMAIMAVATWLPLRARVARTRAGRGASGGM